LSDLPMLQGIGALGAPHGRHAALPKYANLAVRADQCTAFVYLHAPAGRSGLLTQIHRQPKEAVGLGFGAR
jgi:hypothetical protein